VDPREAAGSRDPLDEPPGEVRARASRHADDELSGHGPAV